ncbi:MAG: putative beta-lysine N-acetyltransferase [Desulfobacterales bacterium]
MADTVENILGSRVQHGPHNQRIYLMKLGPRHTPGLVAALDDLARQKSYGKIIAKIPASAWEPFERAGYRIEARVPGLIRNRHEALFVAKYPVPRRAREYRDPFDSASPRPPNSIRARQLRPKAQPSHPVSPLIPDDVEDMRAIYRRVFRSYPFPIDNTHYLKGMMRADVLYYGVRMEGSLAAIAGAEMDATDRNVEMTDFATRPSWRGRGLAKSLLTHMERTCRGLGFLTAYTIARSASAGMNRVFQSRGYHQGGRLINNTQISGKIQTMTVWYRRL